MLDVKERLADGSTTTVTVLCRKSFLFSPVHFVLSSYISVRFLLCLVLMPHQLYCGCFKSKQVPCLWSASISICLLMFSVAYAYEAGYYHRKPTYTGETTFGQAEALLIDGEELQRGCKSSPLVKRQTLSVSNGSK